MGLTYLVFEQEYFSRTKGDFMLFLLSLNQHISPPLMF